MNQIQLVRPDLNRVPSFYHNYIHQVPGNDLIAALNDQSKRITGFFRDIPETKWEYSYAPGKWTIKELVQHIIDAERIFSYRALRFARLDPTELPGFDENYFTVYAKASRRSPEELLKELEAVQNASLLLFQSFDDEQLEASGISNGSSIYVRGIGFIIAGHALHHKNVVVERYLTDKALQH